MKNQLVKDLSFQELKEIEGGNDDMRQMFYDGVYYMVRGVRFLYDISVELSKAQKAAFSETHGNYIRE